MGTFQIPLKLIVRAGWGMVRDCEARQGETGMDTEAHGRRKPTEFEEFP